MLVSRSEPRASEVQKVGALLALSLALFAGCATWGGVPDDELPAQPIAIYYRTPEEARLRASSGVR